MGHGSYTAQDWTRLKQSRGLSQNSSAAQTFVKSEIDDRFNSRFIHVRESCDSEDSPNSTPIIIGFDVTGSMGYLANEIATNSLNETIMQILTKKPVTDPHMLCAAITNPSDPIQATQFEADIRVVEQLLDFKLGGWNRYAYDNLLWYFAAKHTKIDSFKKRGKKGVLIGIGDEIVGKKDNILTAEMLKEVFNDDAAADLSFQAAYDLASEKYELVHIVVGENHRFLPSSPRESYSGWQAAMPGRVAKLQEKDIGALADLIVAILQLLGGEDRETVFDQVDPQKQQIIKEALEDFRPNKPTAPRPAPVSAFPTDRVKASAGSNTPKTTAPQPSVKEKTPLAKEEKPLGKAEKFKKKLHDLFGNRK